VYLLRNRVALQQLLILNELKMKKLHGDPPAQ
jgi:hypothetical protein